MKRPRLLCGMGALCAAVVFVAIATAQQSAVPVEAPRAASTSLVPPPSTVRGAGQELRSLVPPQGRPADSVDALLDMLADIKAQKAELEKFERETLALLKEKLNQQQQRLQKLGVEPERHLSPAATVAPSSAY